jgi:hypothetical protein
MKGENIMKKILGILIAVMMVVTLTATFVGAQQEISVKLNDAKIDFADVKPQIISGRTMVPLRAIFEALGASVEWDDATKTVKSTKGDISISLTIGANELKKNGESKALDVPAQIIDSRTMVPVRAISEAYECEVNWDDATKTVLITTPAKEVETSTVMGSNGVPTAIIADPANDASSGFYGNMGFEIAEDPADASNKVFKVSANKEGVVYSYLWTKMEFEAGQTYLVEFDAKVIGYYDGTPLEAGQVGGCFHYNGKDNGSGGGEIYADRWTHFSYTYTIPADYAFKADDDTFGIYGDPKGVQGVTFLVDNVTVAPMTDELQSLIAEKEALAAKKLVEGKTSVLTLNFEKAEDWNIGKITNLVVENGTVKGTAETGDPTLNKKSPVGINIDNVVAMKITALIPDGTNMEIYYSTEEDKNMSESKKFTVKSLSDGVYEYIVDVSANAYWKGTLYGLRIDPVTKEGASFEVVSVEFLG